MSEMIEISSRARFLAHLASVAAIEGGEMIAPPNEGLLPAECWRAIFVERYDPVAGPALHRLALAVLWGDEPPLVTVGQNPSVAGQIKDNGDMKSDATKTRMIKRARSMGAGGHVMLNLATLVETDSPTFWGSPHLDCSLEAGWRMIEHFAPALSQSAWIMAWGGEKKAIGHGVEYRRRLVEFGITDQRCIGLTADGHPRHPSRLGYADQIVRWPLSVAP